MKLEASSLADRGSELTPVGTHIYRERFKLYLLAVDWTTSRKPTYTVKKLYIFEQANIFIHWGEGKRRTQTDWQTRAVPEEAGRGERKDCDLLLRTGSREEDRAMPKKVQLRANGKWHYSCLDTGVCGGVVNFAYAMNKRNISPTSRAGLFIVPMHPARGDKRRSVPKPSYIHINRSPYLCAF